MCSSQDLSTARIFVLVLDLTKTEGRPSLARESESWLEALSDRISEKNQTDEIVSRTFDSAYDSVAYDPVETRSSESQAE